MTALPPATDPPPVDAGGWEPWVPPPWEAPPGVELGFPVETGLPVDVGLPSDDGVAPVAPEPEPVDGVADAAVPAIGPVVPALVGAGPCG